MAAKKVLKLLVKASSGGKRVKYFKTQKSYNRWLKEGKGKKIQREGEALRQKSSATAAKNVLRDINTATTADLIANTKAKMAKLSNKIDKIVLDGGRVGLGNPLSRQMLALSRKMKKLKKLKK